MALNWGSLSFFPRALYYSALNGNGLILKIDLLWIKLIDDWQADRQTGRPIPFSNVDWFVDEPVWKRSIGKLWQPQCLRKDCNTEWAWSWTLPNKTRKVWSQQYWARCVLQVCDHCTYRSAKEYNWQNRAVILAADYASNGIYNFIIPLRAHFRWVILVCCLRKYQRQVLVMRVLSICKGCVHVSSHMKMKLGVNVKFK